LLFKLPRPGGYKACDDVTACTEPTENKLPTTGNYPKESIQ
jgi:hypothetical protein